MPKSQTLEFYKIEKDGEVFKVMGEQMEILIILLSIIIL